MYNICVDPSVAIYLESGKTPPGEAAMWIQLEPGDANIDCQNATLSPGLLPEWSSFFPCQF
ncbi:hypothetical protein M413DRAFT_438381 [Hebeloma cylindrosporum]|uniref:Uncharacterized protein n=1 Tax=Hebeloma cylindrosporum TaxID=76867 RepID=A0A0C3CZE9_HEBCY|nr:hypothetical protein M413DRAFT_438381 [Hebeloma cylindrosporum h7]